MSAGVTKKEPFYIHTGKTYGHRPRSPRRRKAYIHWGAAYFPKGIVNNTAISNTVPCSRRHDTFHLGLGRP